MESLSGAALTVQCLREANVKHILGIPGAKIDRVFDELYGCPELVDCRHEQNAAFIAGAIGRITVRPGICLVTSGPGTSNLATGLITATTEGDPVVAIRGAVVVVKQGIDKECWIALSRMFCMVAGCLVAPVVTLGFSYYNKLIDRKKQNQIQ